MYASERSVGSRYLAIGSEGAGSRKSRKTLVVKKNAGPVQRPPPSSSDKFMIGIFGTLIMIAQMFFYVVFMSNYLVTENSSKNRALAMGGVHSK
mmetsp:Transcript_104210/g.261321  ORF Transcript_104210/g.261321 Transcript_104210/m.261321 type:complete len:94 (-) Transcript_104210:20-301(-)